MSRRVRRRVLWQLLKWIHPERSYSKRGWYVKRTWHSVSIVYRNSWIWVSAPGIILKASRVSLVCCLCCLAYWDKKLLWRLSTSPVRPCWHSHKSRSITSLVQTSTSCSKPVPLTQKKNSICKKTAAMISLDIKVNLTLLHRKESKIKIGQRKYFQLNKLWNNFTTFSKCLHFLRND